MPANGLLRAKYGSPHQNFRYSGLNTNRQWCYNKGMIKQVLISFAVLALSVASAETFKVTLIQPSVIKGTQLKAGDYQLNLKDNGVTIVKGKQKLDVPAKVENADKKYDRTRILYNENKGKFSIQEIELGGTKTKLLFDSGVQSGGGE